ncbi:vWA domain-containing protein [Bacillus infantis]|uniref:VWA domain-containing protein n=1 Tax=Bacillus infantis TaxID=324767 RepID=A0A5D4QQZ5_9BACI|nr:VWA domain-containing protein [Bacillus infantis]TYS40769.1 VWA domain-containing protein [Bacillus infantis]
MRKFYYVSLLAFMMIFTGCSKEDPSAADSSDVKSVKIEEEPVRYPEAATEAEEIVKQQMGEKIEKAMNEGLEEANMTEEEVMADFEAEGMTAEEVYNGLVHWFAVDYSEVNDALANYEPAFGEYGAEEEGQKTKNISIQIDSSGSMNGQVNGGVKMNLAKEAVDNFAAGFPEDTIMTLRTYGHKGTGEDKDKAMSCASTEVMYDANTYDQAAFKAALGKFKPSGWTPLAASIKAGYEDLKKKAGEDTENILYIVSDGIETCDGDPVKEAKVLADSDLNVKVHIIGFNVDDAGQAQLKKTAEAGNGKYYTVNSKLELTNTLNELMGEAISSIRKNNQKAMNGIDINFKSVELRKDVQKLRSNFMNMAGVENEVLRGAAQELESQEKVKSEDVEAITEMADERLSVLAEYIGKLEEDAQEKITVKKDELFEAME